MRRLRRRLKKTIRSNKSKSLTHNKLSLALEWLEPRLLLNASIENIVSTVDDFRFITGDIVPVFNNTYTAQISGSATKVGFQIEGEPEYYDMNAGDGWSSTFDMSSINHNASFITIRAYNGSTVTDSLEYSIDVINIPQWMSQSNVEINVESIGSDIGYVFDVYLKDIDYGFDTPDEWKWDVSHFEAPLIDLSNLHTGFAAGWQFELHSLPNGLMEIHDPGYFLELDVLDIDIWDYKLPTGHNDNWAWGSIEGNYSISFYPKIDAVNLEWTGLECSADFGLNLAKEFDLFSASIDIGPSIPFVASLATLELGLGVGFEIGVDVSATAAITPDGEYGVTNLSFAPGITGNLIGTAEGRLGNILDWSLARAILEIDGTLNQNIIAEYDNDVWDFSAPGDLSVSGNLTWDALFGLFSGGSELFDWEIASWDFADNSHDNPQSQEYARLTYDPPSVWFDTALSTDPMNPTEADSLFTVSAGSSHESGIKSDEYLFYTWKKSGDDWTNVTTWGNCDGTDDIGWLPPGDYRLGVTSVNQLGGIGYSDLKYVHVEDSNTTGNSDVVLSIDRSGSMGSTKIADAKAAAKMFVDLMDAGDKIGIVSYSSSSSVDFPLAEIIESPSGPVVVFYDDMDTADNWNAENNWGLVSSTVGGNCFTDSPSGSYPNSSNTAITLNAPVHIPTGDSSSLNFQTKYDLESGYDYGRVEISNNSGASWSVLTTYNGTENSWQNVTIPLDSYKDSNILLRFRLTTDSSVTRDGWYIDEIEIVQGGSDGQTQSSARAAIDSLNSGGGTSLVAGVQAANDQLNRFPSDPVRSIILMTDGQADSPINYINTNVDENIRIYTIGFGNDTDETMLQNIAATRNGGYFFGGDLFDLQVIYTTLGAMASDDSILLNEISSIQPGQEKYKSVLVEPGMSQVKVGVSWPGSDLDLELISPSGAIITHQSAANNPHTELIEGDTYEFYRITYPQDGNWQAKIIAVDVDPGGEPFHVYGIAETAPAPEAQPEITFLYGFSEIDVISPQGIDYGSCYLGQQNPEIMLEVRNDGEADLQIYELSVSAGLSIVDPLSTAIPPGTTDSFIIRLDTSISGTVSSHLILGCNDQDEAQFIVPIQGHILAPNISVADQLGQTIDIGVGFVDFGEVEYGGSSQHTLNIRNTGDAPLNLQNVVAPNGFSLSQSPNALIQPGMNSQLVIAADTSEIGYREGMISFATNVPDANPFSFSVRVEIAGYETTISPKQKYTFYDDDGDLVTIMFKGPAGSIMEVVKPSGSGSDIARLVLNGTDSKSSLKIVTKGKGSKTSINEIIINGDLKNLQGKTTDVNDLLNISGDLGNVKLNNLENGTIRSGGKIGKVQFNNINNSLLCAKYDIDLVKSKTNIQNTKILAGYDIGSDCLPGTGDEYFNTNSATIKVVIVGKRGNFDGSFALAGVKPWKKDLSEILAPDPTDQIKANYGYITKAKLGQVFSGDPVNGIYGLFAATEIGKVKYQEIFGQNAPDFEIRSL